jgi:PAS domain S-box-containing protein
LNVEGIVHFQASDLEDFFENGELGLHIVAHDGRILRANKAELKLLGYSAEEYIGHHIAEFHIDPSAGQGILERLSRGERLSRYPARLRARDGSIKHVLITSSGRFQDGRFVSTRCFTLDATEAEHARAARAEEERRFRAMLQALPVAIYTTDARGVITFYNEAAVELSGRRPEIGRDQWCVTWRLYKTDGTPLPHDECPMAIALKENRPVRGAEALAERPDGSRIQFVPFPTPLHDEAGQLIGAVNLLMDITKLCEAEADQAHLSAIVESSNDAIISKTLDGRVTSWNAGATKLFGYEEKDIIGQPVTRLIPPERHEEEQDLLARVRRGERIGHYETVRLARDGRRIDISLTLSPVRDSSGKVTGTSSIARDITERKEAENLRQLLLNELNHRVKNTLANVQAIAHHTLRRTRDPEKFATAFSGRIQSLARVHAVLTKSEWQGADLRELIHDQLFQGAVEDTRLTAWGPSVRLSPQTAVHVALIFHELGTNSVKYGALAAPSGWVTVSWAVEDQQLRVRWVERGGATVAAPAVRGFGLALIEQSAKSEGGTAMICYTADGITWDITLPLQNSQAQAGTSQEAGWAGNAPSSHAVETSKPPTVLSGRRLLVVEDEPLIALDIVDYLQDAGAEVAGPAGTEAEALQVIETTALDGALLDANLHGRSVDGIAAALTRRSIPFVFVTGHDARGLPRAFAKTPVVTKPFSPQQLVDAVAPMGARGGTVTPLRR